MSNDYRFARITDNENWRRKFRYEGVAVVERESSDSATGAFYWVASIFADGFAHTYFQKESGPFESDMLAAAELAEWLRDGHGDERG